MNPRLLDTARRLLQAQHKSPKTQQAYLDWIYRFLLFHQKGAVARFSASELETFLRFLAQERKVAAATQNQALQALLFLYKQVLQMPLPDVCHLRTQNAIRIPAVLNRAEIAAVLNQLKGDALLMTSLLYGCGLRVQECVSLRIKDVDLTQHRLHIDGTGGKARALPLPERLVATLTNRLQQLRLQYEQWLQEGFCGVTLPEGLAPDASASWLWQYLFPTDKPSMNVATGSRKLHHRSESFLEKAVKQAAVKAGLSGSICCHTFRNSFAIHLLENRHSLRQVQKLLGHSSLRATKVYARLANRNMIVQSPLDSL